MVDFTEIKELITKGNETQAALRDAVESKADKETVEAIKSDYADLVKEIAAKEAELKVEAKAREMLESRLSDLEMASKSRPGTAGKKSMITEGEKAFYDFLGNTEHKSGFQAHALKMAETKNINTATGSAGGYAVPTEIAAQVLELARDFSPIRRLATVYSVINTDNYSVLINQAGANVRWGNQLATRSGTNAPTLAEVKAAWGTMYTDFGATRQAILQMASTNAVQPWALKEIAAAFAEGEGLAFLTGKGAADPGDDDDQPIGLLHGTTIGRVNSGAAAGLGDNAFDTVIKLFFSIKGEYAQKGTFVMNSATFATLAIAKNENGDYLFPQSLQAGLAGVILGREVAIDENMPAIAAGSTPILFGDITRAYGVFDQPTFFVQENPYRVSGRVYFEAEKRVGGNVLNPNAAKLLRIAA